MHNITNLRALDILKDGFPLENVYIEGALNLSNFENWEEQIVLKNCIIDTFIVSFINLNNSISLIDCQINKADFNACYFQEGLKIINTTFHQDVDFQCSGHNNLGKSIIFYNNEFKGFVNFFDCYFNEVSFIGNTFKKGTNLLGKPQHIEVTFTSPPILHDNQGNLALNHEGNMF